MPKLKFRNQTEEDIIGTPLLFCFFDTPDELSGLQREIIQGERTMSRLTPNQYGTQYSGDSLISFALVKENGSAFTQDEQRTINKWLTSSSLSQSLEFDPDTGVSSIYKGIFTDVRWKISSPGIIGAICDFTCSSPFAWKTVVTALIPGTNKIYVDSDEEEKYVYPTFTVTANATGTVKIQNITDGNNEMTINAYAKLPMTFDCDRCIPSDATTGDIVSYEDLGWGDVGNIYWLRLFPGENTMKITGTATVKLSFEYPQKLLGGWIYDARD